MRIPNLFKNIFKNVRGVVVSSVRDRIGVLISSLVIALLTSLSSVMWNSIQFQLGFADRINQVEADVVTLKQVTGTDSTTIEDILNTLKLIEKDYVETQKDIDYIRSRLDQYILSRP